MMEPLYDIVCEIVGSPMTLEQENICYASACILLFGCIWCIFKVIHYLFHI